MNYHKLFKPSFCIWLKYYLTDLETWLEKKYKLDTDYTYKTIDFL